MAVTIQYVSPRAISDCPLRLRLELVYTAPLQSEFEKYATHFICIFTVVLYEPLPIIYTGSPM